MMNTNSFINKLGLTKEELEMLKNTKIMQMVETLSTGISASYTPYKVWPKISNAITRKHE